MKQDLIRRNIEIAISMLGEVRTDRYRNGRIKHSDRNFVTQTVTELLEEILINHNTYDDLIIPKNSPNINPPEES